MIAIINWFSRINWYRLFIRKNKWYKFSEKLPGSNHGEQVDIIFCSPWWATWSQGVYTHWKWDDGVSVGLRDRLMGYNRAKDKFNAWTSSLPTHWMLAPETPKWDHEKFKRDRKENETLSEYVERTYY